MLGDKHGDIDLSLDGNIIIATFVGSFNEECIVEYSDNIKAMVAEFGDQPFAILVDNRKLEGGTPEAYGVLEGYNQWLLTTKIVAKAFITPSSITMDIINSYAPSIKVQNSKNLSSKEEALDWLKEQLALST